MAYNKLFTLNLTASNTYAFGNDSSANGGVIINDAGSAGAINIQGTASIVINGVLTNSQAISIAANEYIVFGTVTPLQFTITTDAGTTGKIMFGI